MDTGELYIPRPPHLFSSTGHLMLTIRAPFLSPPFLSPLLTLHFHLFAPPAL